MTEPSSSNELERLLVAAANDPAERPAFARALLTNDVYVLGRSDPPPVNGFSPPERWAAYVGYEHRLVPSAGLLAASRARWCSLSSHLGRGDGSWRS